MQSSTTFTRETLQLDGETFDACEFKSCRLVYSGGEVPTFTDCKFEDCDWRLDDAATRTLAHLKVMWGAGAKARVQELIKSVTGSGGK
jgi:hypothetical protein